VMAFYFFLTRMHERYVFAAFLPLLVAAVLINSRLIWGLFVVLSVSHFINLYHVYGYYYPNDLRIEGIFDWLEKGDLFGTSLPLLGRLETVQFFSIVMVVSFIVLLVSTYLRLERPPPGPEAT